VTAFDDLSPREFESAIANILASFGWDVSLTPATRDGGVDIIGVTRDPSGLETTWAVECKHYRSSKVGVETVRQIIGVREALGFDKGVIVTSGDFTADAARIVDQVHGIHLIDRARLAEWRAASDGPPVSAPVIASPFDSCFLSHSTSDVEFASLLASRLRKAGVRVWYAPEQLSAGQKVVDQVDAALSTFERLLVVLSPSSIASKWVSTEIRKAFIRQKEEGRQILFPISLIPFDQLRRWVWIDPDTGEDLALELRSFFIPDFSDWAEPSKFEEQFQRLLSGLQKH
jgi:hypothetical protein